MSHISFQLRQITQRMWFLPAAFSLVAVATIAIAFLLARLAPETLPFTMPADGVVSILTILASSLLTVAVFALSTMVGALASASQSTTPRAVPLIIADRSAQTSISVFIGAFLFSIVGIIGLSAGIYSEAGRLFLFLVTLGVVALVITALIRWIGQISAIGRVGETIDAVEASTVQAFEASAARSLFHCDLASAQPEGDPIVAEHIGYVQHFDAAQLQRLAEEHDLTITVMARPGTFVAPDRPLMLVEGSMAAELATELAAAFVVGDRRTFDGDPRFGLVVLSEIASKALSPGINDPGTAIDVIGTLVRVLLRGGAESEPADLQHKRVRIVPIDPHDLMQDAFRPIARDGAGTIEVMQRLMAGLATIAAGSPELSGPAMAMARDATERARLALAVPSDLAALERASAFAH